MNPKTPRSSSALGFYSFFEKALEVIKPSYMRLLVVFVFALLVTLVFLKASTHLTLCLSIIAIVFVIFAFLTFALEFAAMRFRYLERTQESLKQALRSKVIELAETADKEARQPINHVDEHKQLGRSGSQIDGSTTSITGEQL